MNTLGLNRHVVSLKLVLTLLETSERRRLLFLLSFRTAVNLLDVLALAGVGLLSIIAANASNGGVVTLPAIGSYSFSGDAAFQIAVAVTGLFVFKSLFSGFLIRRTSALINRLETSAAQKCLEVFFDFGNVGKQSRLSLERKQNLITSSLNALYAGVLGSWVIFLAEVTLLLFILLCFMFINATVTICLVLYLGLLIFLLNRMTSGKISVASENGYLAGQRIFSQIADLQNLNRELELRGSLRKYIDGVVNEVQGYSRNATDLSYLGSLPRYFIETALIVGIAGFFGFITIVSDLQSEAGSVGIFIAGGLRIVASLLPLQNSFAGLVQYSAKAQPALSILRSNDIPRKERDRNSQNLGPLGLSVSRLNVFNEKNSLVLKDVTFECPPGTFTLIFGDSGVGKSTLFEYLMGFRLVDQGSISYHSNLKMDILRIDEIKIGFVPQSPKVISGTLLENVLLGLEIPNSKSDVEKLLIDLELGSLLSRLPDGLNTRLSPSTKLLSGGEIQRLGIARSLITKPGILFLDEPTSALDQSLATRVLSYLRAGTETCTIVAISHNQNHGDLADQILNLKNPEAL